jgi:heat shock protein HslJ
MPRITLEADGHRVVGSGGCNRLSGDYQLAGERLRFGHIARTMMACPDGMDTETAFVRALDQVRTWRIVGNGLELYDVGRNQVLRLEVRSR